MKNSKGLIQRLFIGFQRKKESWPKFPKKDPKDFPKERSKRFPVPKISKLKNALFSKAHFQKEIYLLMFYSGIFLQVCLFSCLKQLSER